MITPNDIIFTETRINILIVLAIICAVSFLYCFIVGEITRNNSQMDKLWSILPIIYIWVIFFMGGFNIRILIISIIVTLWGVRLTWNFAKKGAYKLKFWEGEEDYRWQIVRSGKMFAKKWAWALFDLFFISFFQNFVVLLITLPALLLIGNTSPIGVADIIPMVTMFGFWLLETIADKQQWDFQSTKYKMLGEGKELEELPAPYNKGFNTVGLWGHARHPNYLGEMGIWISLYFVGAGSILSECGGMAYLNLTGIGALLLITIFIGSTILAEKISSGKYPLYKDYMKKVSVYIPLWKYKE